MDQMLSTEKRCPYSVTIYELSIMYIFYLSADYRPKFYEIEQLMIAWYL